MSRQGCLRPDYDFAGSALSVFVDDGKTLEECVELCRADDRCFAGIHRYDRHSDHAHTSIVLSVLEDDIPKRMKLFWHLM